MSWGEITVIVGAGTQLDIAVNDVSGSPVNPDTLAVTFRCQGQPAVGPFTWTNPPGIDPSATITNTGVGTFTADWTPTSAGSWTYSVSAQPLSGLDISGTSWIKEGEILVSRSGVS
jgi:hypothetical protein